MKKTLLSVLGAVMLSASLFSSVTTAADQQEQTVEVVGSGLRLFQTDIKFDDIRLDVKRNQTSKAVTNMYMIDGRGSDAGWTVSMSATDFELDKAGVKYYIPISSVEVTTEYSQAVTGAEINFAAGHGTLSSKKVLSATPQTLIQANPSYGGGTHQFSVQYDLKLPKLALKEDGTETGVMQGTYKSVFRYTAVSGI